MLKKQGPSGDTADFVRLPFKPAAASAACCVSVRHEINSYMEVYFFQNGWCMHISFLQPAGKLSLRKPAAVKVRGATCATCTLDSRRDASTIGTSPV